MIETISLLLVILVAVILGVVVVQISRGFDDLP